MSRQWGPLDVLAAAAAVTALAASNDAEAAIYYSGAVDIAVSSGHGAKMSTLHSHARGFPPFPGTQSIGTFIDPSRRWLERECQDRAKPLAAVKIVGFQATSRSGGKFNYASKLTFGANIAAQNFPASTPRTSRLWLCQL